MNQIHKLNCSDYYQHVMQPFPLSNPCGENLDYDPAFIMLQSRLEPRLGAEYGNFIEAAEPINWTETERDCLALLQKSKDIRLIIILMRCRLRKIGLSAIAEGTEVLYALLCAWPDDLYPQLLDEGEFAPIMRANAFAELEDIDGLLAELRNQLLPKAAGIQITIREFEKSHLFTREPGALSETAVAALVHEWHLNDREALHPLILAYLFVQEIKQALEKMLGSEAPELAALTNILALFYKEFGGQQPESGGQIDPMVQSVGMPDKEGSKSPSDGPEESETEVAITASVPVVRVHAGHKTINTRAEALQSLKEIRSWFGMTEPSSPLVLLLQYAEESIGRNFADLIKMYPPEIVAILSQEKE